MSRKNRAQIILSYPRPRYAKKVPGIQFAKQELYIPTMYGLRSPVAQRKPGQNVLLNYTSIDLYRSPPTRGCYDRGSTFFSSEIFLNDGGSLTHNRRISRPFFFSCVTILVVYLLYCRPCGVCHPVAALYIYIFLQEISFGERGLELPELRSSVGKKVVHLYRSTRLLAFNQFVEVGLVQVVYDPR